MAEPKASPNRGFQSTAKDDLQTALALVRDNIECADSLQVELAGVERLIQDALKKLNL